ncbi:hypothetical protein IE53DRAFT_309679 [Violaceomyces palustris]|uniref:Uncharacterized protein n=1 Tax=Violaceomyces palustris TaxID=1673888 RepID=A0ACD0P6F4_9BASI|nr:hypothetical protein IE53DRAFT_309679 [Violaceomyces palustris]
MKRRRSKGVKPARSIVAKDEGGAQPSLQQEAQANASIWPIQVSYLSSARHASEPEIVHLPEIDFEDASFFFNFSKLAPIQGHGFLSSGAQDHQEDVGGSGINAAGKKKRPSSQSPPPDPQSKRLKRESLLSIIDASLFFKVQPRNTEDHYLTANVLRILASQPGVELNLGPCRLDTELLEHHNESIFHAKAKLWDASGSLLSTLPIMQTHGFDPSLRPDKFTNGEWIVSLTRLLSNPRDSYEHVSVECNLYVVPQLQGASFSDDILVLRLSVHVSLTEGGFQPAPSRYHADLLVDLVRFFDENGSVKEEQLRRQRVDATFVYANLSNSTVHVPEQIQPELLNPTLLPFQQRSTSFLLGREGKYLDPSGRLENSTGLMTSSGPTKVGLWWKEVKNGLYFHPLLGSFSQRASDTLSSNLTGAIIAEEMGLGKTVEVAALILLNPDESRSRQPTYYDSGNDIQVQPCKTTLIVAPETLRQQWVDELALHTPELLIYSYRGRVKAEKDVPEGKSWAEWARSFDVIITSFAVLSQELQTAKKAPERSMRQARKYERPRSPLIQLDFLRVVMDEVQLVGQASAAETASMISRYSSIAVSGTPVKSISDLKSCFRFLRVPGYLDDVASWDRLCSSRLSPYLARVLQALATRHTKLQVAHEMALPLQYRAVVPIDFTSIEAAFYADVWKGALEGLGVDSNGKPLSPHWELDVNATRGFLLNLRQACTHPQVAIHGRNGVLGSHNLRSIDDVLELMIDGTKSEGMTTSLSLWDKMITRAILIMETKDLQRMGSLRHHFSKLEQELKAKLAELAKEIQIGKRQGPLYRLENEELEEEAKRELENANSPEPQEGGLDSFQHVRDDQDTEKRKLRAAHLQGLRNWTRLLLLRLHRVQQYSGNLFHQLGDLMRERDDRDAEAAKATANYHENDGKVDVEVKLEQQEEVIGTGLTELDKLKILEDQAYLQAEETRQLILMESKNGVVSASERLRKRYIDFTAFDMLCRSDLFKGGGGLETAFHYEALSENCHLLNRNADVILRWRENIIERLLRPVNRDINLEKDDDDQYQENLDTQAEAEALLEMYRPLLAEREAIFNGHIVLGATSKPQLFTQLEAAVRLARRRALIGARDEALQIDEELVQIQQQQLEHLKKLEAERQSVSLERDETCFSALITQLKDVAERTDRHVEGHLAQIAIAEARKMMKEQSKFSEKLKAEQSLLAYLFNKRSQYFKEMQAISDTVRDPEYKNLAKSIEATIREEGILRGKLETNNSRLRYLQHLQKVQSVESLDEEVKHCYICTDLILTGILTNACGHVCCEKCFNMWQSSGNRTCPMCKTRVLPSEVHRIVYRKVVAPIHGGKDQGGQLPLLGYNTIDDFRRRKIDSTETQGRYGSKIDTLVKHIKHIVSCTGEKSLVFSSFARGLDVVAQSLTANGIKFIRFGGAGKMGSKSVEQFRNTDTSVMLLHSEAQSAGLNLLAATHIHLLEPLLNRSLELQALGRVHRIGQTKRTFVWCYYVTDTVEESILALAASKGQSLYLKGHSTSESTRTLGSDMCSVDAKIWGQGSQQRIGSTSSTALKGDFTTDRSDLLNCFFPNHSREAVKPSAVPNARDPLPGPSVSSSNVSSSLKALPRNLRRPDEVSCRKKEMQIQSTSLGLFFLNFFHIQTLTNPSPSRSSIISTLID